jgi:hypothetical protein
MPRAFHSENQPSKQLVRCSGYKLPNGEIGREAHYETSDRFWVEHHCTKGWSSRCKFCDYWYKRVRREEAAIKEGTDYRPLEMVTPMQQSLRERFDYYTVTVDEILRWRGPVTSTGHGVTNVSIPGQRRKLFAHRLSLMVLHAIDIPRRYVVHQFGVDSDVVDPRYLMILTSGQLRQLTERLAGDCDSSREAETIAWSQHRANLLDCLINHPNDWDVLGIV